MKTFLELFNIILSGDKDASRRAAREVRKFLYSSRGEKDKYKDIKNLVNKAPFEYKKIQEDWRRENFVMAISVIYFLHDKENQPDFLFPWLYNLIQDPSGNIRHAAVRMLEHELGLLTVHLRHPGKTSLSELAPEESDMTLFELYANLMALINEFWKPAYKKYKYISSLPPGPYKSVQMILARIEEDCGKEYIDRMNVDLGY